MKKPIRAGLKRPIRLKLFILSLCTFLLCCKARKEAAKAIYPKDVDSPLTLILEDDYSGYEATESLIIENAKSLKAFFSKINRTRKPGLPVPKIDFSQETVIVFCPGIQKSGLRSRLQFVMETDDEMVFKSIEEGVVNELTFAEISPFYLYKMPLTSKKITVISGE